MRKCNKIKIYNIYEYMKKQELKSIIHECITEIINEERVYNIIKTKSWKYPSNDLINEAVDESLKSFSDKIKRGFGKGSEFKKRMNLGKGAFKAAKTHAKKGLSSAGSTVVDAAKEELVDPALKSVANSLEKISNKANSYIKDISKKIADAKGEHAKQLVMNWLSQANTKLDGEYRSIFDQGKKLGYTDDEVLTFLTPIIMKVFFQQ